MEQLTLKKLINVAIRTVISSALIFSFFIFSWLFYVLTATKQYTAAALLQIEESNGRQTLSELSYVGSGQGYNLNEVIRVMQSRSILERVIDKHQLQLSLEGLSFDIEDSDFFSNIYIDTENDFLKNFKIILEDEYFSVLETNSKEQQTTKHPYNTLVDKNSFEIKIDRKADKKFINTQLNISYIDKDSTLRKLRSSFVASTSAQRYPLKNTLIEIAYTNSDKSLGKKVLNSIISFYSSDSVSANKSEADSSILFLNERILDINQILAMSEKKMSDFQKENLYFQQDQEASLLYQSLDSIDSQLFEMQLESAEAESTFSTDSIILVNLQNQIDILNNRKSEVLSKISLLPQIQQNFANLQREIMVNQEVLKILQERKLEFSIDAASTLSDLRIIDDPYIRGLASPNYTFSLFVIILISLISSIFLILYRAIYRYTLTSPDDIDSYGITLTGVLPTLDSGLVTDTSVESLNNLSTNILIAANYKKILMFTGPVQGVGKTTVSSNVAQNLAIQGKKILLVDLDFRRGNLHELFNLSKVSHDFYNHGDINQYKVANNLHVIPRPKSNTLTKSFFTSSSFEEFLSKAKDKFDHIILDTPPTIPIVDPLVIASSAEAIFSVVRHRKTFERDVFEVISSLELVSKNHVGVIYNDYSRSFGTYSYYEYKYYKNYYEQD